MNRVRYLALLLVVAGSGALAGCELTEVAIPDGDPVVVVHAVMRPDLSEQWVVVERSLTGDETRQSTTGDIPIDRPQRPLAGASVVVRNLTFDDARCGGDVVFTRQPPSRSIAATDGIYWAPRACPTMRAGDSLSLRVETPDGVVVTGRTTVTAAERTVLRLRGDTFVLPGAELRFNRDRDTVEAMVSAIVGRALQVDVRRPALPGTPRRQRITSIVVDTTAVRVPGDLIDVFSAGSGGDVFRPGRIYTLSVALTEGNYFDFVRSANGTVTGRGFINHLTGGLGVFGSLVAESGTLRVVGDLDDPREGAYRMRGLVRAMAVDLEWNLYLARSIPDSTDFSALVTGDWVAGAFDDSVDGYMVGDSLVAVIDQLVGDPILEGEGLVTRLWLDGLLRPGVSGSIVVRNSLGSIVGTLTATR